MRRETTKFDSMSMKRKSLCCSNEIGDRVGIEGSFVFIETSSQFNKRGRRMNQQWKQVQSNSTNQTKKIRLSILFDAIREFQSKRTRNKSGNVVFFCLDKFRATSRDPNKLNTNKDFHWRTSIWLETNDRFVSKKFYFLVVVLWSIDEDECVLIDDLFRWQQVDSFLTIEKCRFIDFRWNNIDRFELFFKKKNKKRKGTFREKQFNVTHIFDHWINDFQKRVQAKNRKSMFQSKF